MSFNLTKSALALVMISLFSITIVAFMMSWSSFYGVTVPDQYQDSFNNFDDLQSQYGNVQQTIETGEVQDSNSDWGVFKAAITAVRQMGNIGVFANSVLTDLATFLHIPRYWLDGFFLMLGILITAAIIAFFTRGAQP